MAKALPRAPIDGTTVAMGGRDWIVPPLTLGQLRRLMPKMRDLPKIGVSMDPTHIDAVIEIVSVAMSRNYPDITADAVAELLDMGNAAEVFNAVMNASGVRPAKPGEAQAVADMASATSTDFSPPLADTRSP